MQVRITLFYIKESSLVGLLNVGIEKLLDLQPYAVDISASGQACPPHRPISIPKPLKLLGVQNRR